MSLKYGNGSAPKRGKSPQQIQKEAASDRSPTPKKRDRKISESRREVLRRVGLAPR